MTGIVFVTQVLAMGYFVGDQRGLNLAVEAVSYNAYSYKGLVRNELQQGHIWGCPQQQFPAVAQVIHLQYHIGGHSQLLWSC